MSATVTWSLEGSPPCSWEPLLGEGSISLKNLIPLLSHWSDHLSCSNQCAGLLSSPLCSFFWDEVFFLSGWSMNLICMIHALKISRMVMSVTCYELRIDNPKSCHVWDDLQCDWCSVSQWGLWLCPLWVEWDPHELLHVVAASIPVLWSRVASVQIAMTQAAMSSLVGVWSWMALSFLIFLMVP